MKIEIKVDVDEDYSVPVKDNKLPDVNAPAPVALLEDPDK